MGGNIQLFLIGIVFFGILILVFIVGSSIKLWVQALVSGAHVGILNIVFMRFRKVPPKLIVESLIMAVKAGITLDTDGLESHYLAGGNVTRVVQALIAADKANIDLNFQSATGIDLAGRDVYDAVRTSVNPKVIETPIVSAVAGDSHRNAETRRDLQPLADLAASMRCVLLGITHFSKGTVGRDPVERPPAASLLARWPAW